MDADPLFDEPWQAQALAIADSLVRAGAFTADAWASALGAELRAAADTGTADDAETYYRAVVAALERLLNETGAVERDEAEARREQWRRAYLNTPHGKPVELAAGKKQ